MTLGKGQPLGCWTHSGQYSKRACIRNAAVGFWGIAWCTIRKMERKGSPNLGCNLQSHSPS